MSRGAKKSEGEVTGKLEAILNNQDLRKDYTCRSQATSTDKKNLENIHASTNICDLKLSGVLIIKSQHDKTLLIKCTLCTNFT